MTENYDNENIDNMIESFENLNELSESINFIFLKMNLNSKYIHLEELLVNFPKLKKSEQDILKKTIFNGKTKIQKQKFLNNINNLLMYIIKQN